MELTKGRPVHFKSMNDFRMLKEKKGPDGVRKDRATQRFEKLEEKVRGLELMIFNTRAQLMTFLYEHGIYLNPEKIKEYKKKCLKREPKGSHKPTII